MSDRQDRPDPWRAPVTVAQIPERGLHRELDADEAQRKAMAEIGGAARGALRARFVRRDAEERRALPRGGSRARAGRADLRGDARSDRDRHRRADRSDVRARRSKFPALSDLVDDAADDGDDVDPPEPIENGVIDLGRLATDALFLGIDPYPRKPDAVFDHEVTPPDPEDHPFAALKALKAKPKAKRKPKSK